MCSSTICSWSSFAADHRDTMENPHVPKGVCVTLGTYDALYARLYCRLEMCGKGASVYCLIASRLDYTETRRTQGLWIQLPGRRGWAMFDHLKSRSVDTFLLVWVQVRKGLNEGPIYWMSVWLQLTFTRCRGLWMPWSMVDVICMIQHDPTLLKGTGWLMRTRAMRMWLQRMSSAVGRLNSTRAACGSFLALCGGLLGDKTSTCINMQRSINRSNNSPVDSPSQLFCWQRLIEIRC